MKELNSDKLKKFRGGVELEEYCEIMCNMMINNWDSWTWEQQHETRPRKVYKRHLGKNPNNYERGIGMRKSRPLLSEEQEKSLNAEECAVCPEFDTCQGTIVPCPRYPVRVGAPRNRVMKLGDFEE